MKGQHDCVKKSGALNYMDKCIDYYWQSGHPPFADYNRPSRGIAPILDPLMITAYLVALNSHLVN